MAKSHQANLQAEGKKFALVISRFNDFITRRLLDGAEDALVRHGAKAEDVDAYWVPGSFEIPAAALRLARAGKHDAIICLGAVIRGQTPHFDYVAGEAAKGIAQVAMSTGVPTIFGIVTADTIEQAIDRAGAKAGNRGADAALAAIEMANLFAEME